MTVRQYFISGLSCPKSEKFVEFPSLHNQTEDQWGPVKRLRWAKNQKTSLLVSEIRWVDLADVSEAGLEQSEDFEW